MSDEKDVARLKEEAARRAVTYVEDGMIVGLGTGSTARFMIAALGERVKNEGLRIEAIATSEASDVQARELGIPMTDFAAHSVFDIGIDGADEVERGTLELVKGLGGALLREKIVASACRRFVVIVDESKLVDRLGTHAPLPVEVVPWGWERAARLLAETGAQAAKPRMVRDKLFVTDNSNLILDCHYPGIDDPAALSRAILAITGVVDHGLFLGMTSEVLVAGTGGVQRLVP
ncbi:ribose-5-phosphate isomerase RpiA [Acidomonas methanolica]|uniref:Ribose-5-phosphate isomerase A n=1 Tax=Acidomonas methanolica NBRC 104435 TaxID=1231351 RepID=A0A023D0U3_ACIMT|nr:ribose-5-phosphate isomerase RpiA [Acidomonas methanolica]MBU2653411.1 ribose-5-phosphate isomerase RpiA [Acidomonas methanolica]TCS32362.1 ribose-5-phosphate isomerase [Acidomonas methanolica]GAJ27737.1 ribose 5-phosphate isomerase A [Acidomonas methanolica NBRC 104435]GBQ53284.1 ribose 5-phosphate isomerase A [Acidomonas methanolica]GEK97799.1 ribose-5-phosphate isomerase A [Acidomonas methanolica NBRC 104435]